MFPLVSSLARTPKELGLQIGAYRKTATSAKQGQKDTLESNPEKDQGK
jgi:hypothetical protein